MCPAGQVKRPLDTADTGKTTLGQSGDDSGKGNSSLDSDAPRADHRGMADDDDIEALLREIDQMNAADGGAKGGAVVPAEKPAEVAETEDGSGGRLAWAGIAAVGSGAVGFLLGFLLWFMPWISPGSTAVGAALGGAIVALVSGPPGWMKD